MDVFYVKAQCKPCIAKSFLKHLQKFKNLQMKQLKYSAACLVTVDIDSFWAALMKGNMAAE